MTAIGLVDTHAHLMDDAFDADRAEALRRARQAGVEALVLVGYDLESSQQAIKLARTIPWAMAAVGIHPNSAGAATPDEFKALEQLAKDPLVVAIGETGLDYFRDRTPPHTQRQSFEWHLDLAKQRKLPVVVHTRDAHDDVATMLEHANAGGILHCYTGPRSFADRVLQAGYYLSFAGPLTYKNNREAQQVAATAPQDRILIETDCPYLPPARHRGQRNEPAYIKETAQFFAELRGTPYDDLVHQLWDNSVRVFPAIARVAQEIA